MSIAGRCKQVVKRVEKDIVTQNENCYQKNTELCGPANCKVNMVCLKCNIYYVTFSLLTKLWIAMKRTAV